MAAKLFYAAFNAADTTLYMHALDSIQQSTREEWLKTIETAFLREDVALIEVWCMRGPHNARTIESFTQYHQDLHYGTCECGCNRRVLMTMHNTRCERCQRLKCKEHGKFHYGTRKSLCLDCFNLAEQEGK